MVALANGAADANPTADTNPENHANPKFGGHAHAHGHGPSSFASHRQGQGHGLASVNFPASPDAADELLDIIPAPVASSRDDDGDSGSREEGYAYGTHGMSPAGGGFPAGVGAGASRSSSSSRSTPTVGCPDMLANIHMRLLDFLAWDRTRDLRCGREGKQEAYWRSLLPPVNRVGGPAGASGGAAGAGGAGGAAAANGEAATAGDEEEFGGAPETTLPGLRDSKELIQASPHGFPELLRLVAIRREGVLRRVETRRMAAARGFAGLGFQREGARGRDLRVLQARVLDPLGEAMRILRHVLKSEEAKPFASSPSDDDVEPEPEVEVAGLVGVGVNGEGEGDGDGVADGAVKKEKARPKRPLDLGTILRRAENGWYDLEPGAEVSGQNHALDSYVIVGVVVFVAVPAVAAVETLLSCCCDFFLLQPPPPRLLAFPWLLLLEFEVCCSCYRPFLRACLVTPSY